MSRPPSPAKAVPSDMSHRVCYLCMFPVNHLSYRYCKLLRPVHAVVSRYTDEQGYFWWEPAKCKLRRLTGPQARRCLAGRHIVFVGDSLTRSEQLLNRLQLMLLCAQA